MKCQHSLGQFEKFVHAMVENAVLGRWKQAELTIESEDVPGIDKGTALDSAIKQFAHFGWNADRSIQIGCL